MSGFNRHDKLELVGATPLCVSHLNISITSAYFRFATLFFPVFGPFLFLIRGVFFIGMVRFCVFA
jgi:hypothetical protein